MAGRPATTRRGACSSAELIAHQLVTVARCDADPLMDFALSSDWELDAQRIDCPVRIVWGTADRLLPRNSAP